MEDKDIINNTNNVLIKSYSVNEAVWIAAALYAYKHFDESDLSSVYLSASDLIDIALNFTLKDINVARVYQHCNGDHRECTYKYLRKGKDENVLFRVTAVGEFNGIREFPDSINPKDKINIDNNKIITVGDLIAFISTDYANLVKKHTTLNAEINYMGILDYVKNNRELPYTNPEKPGLTEEEKKNNLTIKDNGQKVVNELKKIYKLCSDKFALSFCEPIRWDDGSHQKTRKYLWIQMKYPAYEEECESISIFVEMQTRENPVFRVSLELKNDIAGKEEVQRYHQHLEIPLNDTADLVYVTGSNDLGRPYILSENQELIKKKVQNGEYGKVQVSRYISPIDYPTNEQIEVEILKAVENLLPYYQHVIGVKEESEIMNVKNNTIEFDKNTILYGPPGTGKTYSTAKYAVSICDGVELQSLNDYSAVMKRYRELMEQERIAFVTFHQSYGYEEFIEGIKPVLKTNVIAEDCQKDGEIRYDVVDGVFKAFCAKARTSSVINSDKELGVTNKTAIWKVTVRDEVLEDCFEHNRVRINWEMDTDGAVAFVEEIQKGDIIITTNGSRSSINGIAVVSSDEAEKLEKETNTTSREVNWLVKNIDSNIKSINDNKILHRKTVARVPNMAVADIIALAKSLDSENSVLAETKIEKNNKPYVFVIDEINRGNISKIFGELITLIEDTKREGLEECIPAILPYSGDKFTVPNNVYILGTMNTADRSIALMDTALRRRFRFIEMLPDCNLLKGIVVEDSGEKVNIGEMLQILNERITYLYDREHTIGHAIFMSLIHNNTIDQLATIFSKSVLPLLQEYFYEDYEKIRIVLGDNGKEDDDTKFVTFDNIDETIFEGEVIGDIDIPERSYRIEYSNFYNILSYKRISKKL